jgi:hypothetical protein
MTLPRLGTVYRETLCDETDVVLGLLSRAERLRVVCGQ